MDTQRLVDEAAGDVDRSLLEGTESGGMLSTGYFSDGALVERLREGEGVDYALQNLTKGLKVERDSQTDKFNPGTNFRSALLVTDDRLLYVVGQDEGDETFSVLFSRVHDVDTSTGMLKDRITVYTGAETYDMYVQKASEVEEVAEHIASATEVARADCRTECDGESNPKSMPINKDEAGERDDTSSESDTGKSSEESDHGSPSDGESLEKVRIDSRNSDDEFIWTDSDNVESSSGEDAAETEPDVDPTSLATKSNTHEPGISDDTIESGTDVATESSANVEVLVSDEDGQPVADAQVTVAGTTFEADEWTTQTGRCHLELPPRTETVDVVVEHDKHGLIRENISAVDGTVVDVTLGETGESKNQTGSAEGLESRLMDKDPLADDLEAAPTGRLSDVVVEVHEVHEVTLEKRAAEYEVKAAAGDLVEFVVWEKHGLDFDAEPGTRLRLDDIRLARWETDDGPSHQLDSTVDLEVSVVAEGESTDDARGESVCDETVASAVERFVGIGGATESDAEALVNAGYTTIEDLEPVTIEELRSIPALNNGTALRIKAELG
jgi:hypothetical protein